MDLKAKAIPRKHEAKEETAETKGKTTKSKKK
jgi:hypothetical protein